MQQLARSRSLQRVLVGVVLACSEDLKLVSQPAKPKFILAHALMLHWQVTASQTKLQAAAYNFWTTRAEELAQQLNCLKRGIPSAAL